QQIQRCDAFGHAGGVVVAGRCLHDAVAEPQPRRPSSDGGQEDLGCRGVAVLLEEVVLDHPGGVDADAVGQLALLDGVGEHGGLGVVVPRPGQLMLEEQSDLDGVILSSQGCGRRRSGQAKESTCSAPLRSAMSCIASSVVARRRLAGALPSGVDRCTGGPNRTETGRKRCGSRSSGSCTWSVPTRPTGTMAAPVAAARRAGPSLPRWSLPSLDLVPSG